MKLIIATTVLALTSGTAFAQGTGAEMPELTKPQIAFLDAAAIAGDAAKGDLVSMELDYIDETDPVYLAELEAEAGFARVMIDGDSGDILASETIDAASQDALDAYMENFSMQAELAEMVALNQMLDTACEGEGLDLSEDELDALEEVFDNMDDAELEELLGSLDDADLEELFEQMRDAALKDLAADVADE